MPSSPSAVESLYDKRMDGFSQDGIYKVVHRSFSAGVCKEVQVRQVGWMSQRHWGGDFQDKVPVWRHDWLAQIGGSEYVAFDKGSFVRLEFTMTGGLAPIAMSTAPA